MWPWHFFVRFTHQAVLKQIQALRPAYLFIACAEMWICCIDCSLPSVSQADWERNWFLFFSLHFRIDMAVDHYISVPLTVGMLSRCCAFPLSFPSLSLSLRLSPSSTSPAVCFLLWNPFIHFLDTCQIDSAAKTATEQCLVRNLMIPRAEESRDIIVQLWSECEQLIIHRYSSSSLSRPKKSETVRSAIKTKAEKGTIVAV